MLESKQVKAVTAAALVLSCVAGLAYTGTRSRTLDVLVYDDPTAERVVKFLDEWAKDKKIELQVTRLPYDELYYTVRDRGAEYDLLLIDDPWLPALAEKGDVLSPVTDKDLRLRMPLYAPQFSEVCYYRKGRPSPGLKVPRRPSNEVYKCSDNAPACTGVYEGWELYAMPVVGNVQLLLVADDLLLGHAASDPLSWTQLRKAIKEHGQTSDHSGPGKRPVRFVFRGGSSNAALADFLPFLHAWNARLMSADEVVTLDDGQNAREALQFSLDLASFSPVQHARLNDRDVYQQLANDEAEAGVCWLAYVSGINAERKRRNGDAPGHKGLVELPMPNPDTPERTPAGVTGAWLIAVGQKARNAGGAWEFVDYLTSGEVAKKMADDGNPAAYKDLLAGNEGIVDAARPRPAHPCWKEIEDAAGLRIQQAYWRTVTPDEALKRAASDIKKILAAEKAWNPDTDKWPCAIQAGLTPQKGGSH